MFKKPKRSIRARQRDSDDSDDCVIIEDLTNVNGEKKDGDKPEKSLKKKKEKVDESTKSVLSFDHDEGDGEIFKIKKSSHSKRIVKQLKKESLKEKEGEKGNGTVKVTSLNQNLSFEASDDMQRLSETASAANDETRSGDEGSDSDSHGNGSIKFRQPEFKTMLESGEIPDATMIHLARKRREMVRKQGGEEYIPIDDTVRADKISSRLIREDDDNDRSDDSDEERVNFSSLSTQRDSVLRHMQKTILEAEEASGSDDSDHERQWEEQQIRKGVSIPAQQPTASPSTFHGDGFPGSLAQYATGYQSFASTNDYLALLSNAAAYSALGANGAGGEVGSLPQVTQRSFAPPSNAEDVTVDGIVKRLQERLNEVGTVHRAHLHERDDIESRVDSSEISIAQLETEAPSLKEQYTFFQEARGYVRDLVDCFSEKMAAINFLERRMDNLLRQRVEKLIKRRQDDVKDQSQDYLPSKAAAVIGTNPSADDIAKQRRVAEREARRSRRRRMRETSRASDHNDGVSTDDEENNSDIIKYRTEKDLIKHDLDLLFDDVADDFHNVDLIMSRFSNWREKYRESYDEAYISLCVPKLLQPLIRSTLIMWNPFDPNCENIETMEWYESLSLYSIQTINGELQKDEHDIKILPTIVEKVILFKLTGLVEKVFDPMSSKQTTRLVAITERLIDDYSTLSAENKATQALLKAIVERLRKALDDDIFVPLYPKEVLENKFSGCSVFFHRQFWNGVKLMDNIVQWQNVLSKKVLQHLALEGILNRYLVLSLNNSPVNAESINKCQAIAALLPKDWFFEVGETTINQLEPFCRYLISAAAAIDTSTADKQSTRSLVKQIARLLMSVHALNHAEKMARQYSLRL